MHGLKKLFAKLIITAGSGFAGQGAKVVVQFAKVGHLWPTSCILRRVQQWLSAVFVVSWRYEILKQNT